MAKKTKRKMPAHIVLPNGMWRFVKSGTKKVKASRKVRKSRRRVSNMARRRRASRKRSSFGGSNKLMSGLYRPPAMLEKALVGAGAATISEKVLPQVIPYQNAVVGFVVGGAPGAAGALAKDLLKSMQTGGASSSPYGN